MDISAFAVFACYLGFVLVDVAILKCLEGRTGIGFAGLIPLVVYFITFPADNIVTEYLSGRIIGPDDIQVIVYHGNVISDGTQHGAEFSFADTQRLLGLLAMFDHLVESIG